MKRTSLVYSGIFFKYAIELTLNLQILFQKLKVPAEKAVSSPDSLYFWVDI
jgi:hypothetical protein